MKKQSKIFIIVVVVLVVAIALVSLFYPGVYKGLATGTFGKAEKYRKATMSEKDILLRSEFTADTSKLKGMISGLVYFSAFSNDLAKTLDTGIVVFKSNGIEVNREDSQQLQMMQDYSDFIKNNTKTLNSTIALLTSFYMDETPDESVDIEKNLIDFGNYVKNLNQKDSVFNKTFERMDNFLLKNKTLAQKPAEFANLKSIRDNMLIKGIELSGVLQNTQLCGSLCSYALSSQNAYNIIVLATDNLGVVASAEISSQLNSLVVNSQLNLYSSAEMGAALNSQLQSAQGVGAQDQVGAGEGMCLVYNSSNLQFIAASSTQLQSVLSSTQLSSVLSGRSEGIGLFPIAFVDVVESFVVGSQYDLSSTLQSSGLGSVLNSSQLGALMGVLNNSALMSTSQLGSGFIGALNLGSSLQGIEQPNF